MKDIRELSSKNVLDQAFRLLPHGFAFKEACQKRYILRGEIPAEITQKPL